MAHQSSHHLDKGKREGYLTIIQTLLTRTACPATPCATRALYIYGNPGLNCFPMDSDAFDAIPYYNGPDRCKDPGQCAAGEFHNGMTCTACKGGTYKAVSGAGSCSSCPSGERVFDMQLLTSCL